MKPGTKSPFMGMKPVHIVPFLKSVLGPGFPAMRFIDVFEQLTIPPPGA